MISLFKKKKEEITRGFIIRIFYPEVSRELCIFSPSLLKMRLEDFNGNVYEEDFFDRTKLKEWIREFPNSVIVEDFDYGYCQRPISTHLLGRLKIIEEID